MAVLTARQIAQYAYNAGFRGDALNQAVAIALAESGGNPAAYNPESAAGTKSGSGSRGLWQIYGTAHPEFNNSKAFDPQVNANAAFKVFREAGNRFSPWSTWNAGVRARQNYASMIGGKTVVKSNPVSTVARGSTQPVMATNRTTGQPIGATAAATTGYTPPTLRSFLGFGDSAKSGESIVYDFVFMGLGGSLILIGVISLLVMGTGKVAYDNRETIAEVAKLAAI